MKVNGKSILARSLVYITLLFTSQSLFAEGAGLTIRSIFYCGDDFSMYMSNNERWVVKKSQVGEQKLNHFIAIALYIQATGKKTGNIFPGTPQTWCGNDNTRPISILSTQN